MNVLRQRLIVCVLLAVGSMPIFSAGLAQDAPATAPANRAAQAVPAAALADDVAALLDSIAVSPGNRAPVPIVRGAVLGVFLRTVNDLTNHGGRADEVGVAIDDVNNHSPAQHAGLQKGDIIVGIDEFHFNRENAPDAKGTFSEILRGKDGGETVAMHVLRGPEYEGGAWSRLSVDVTLGVRAMADLPASAHENFARPAPSWLETEMAKAPAHTFAEAENHAAVAVTALERYREVADSIARISYTDEGLAHIPGNPIPFRLPEVTYCLRNPLHSAAVAREMANEIRASADSATASDGTLARLMDVPLAKLGGQIDAESEAALSAYLGRVAGADPFGRLELLLATKRLEVDRMVNALGEGARDFLWDKVPALYAEESDATGETSEEPGESKKLTPADRVKIQRLMAALDRGKFYGAIAGTLTHLSPAFIRELREAAQQMPAIVVPDEFAGAFTGEIRLIRQTAAGLIVVGGPGANEYRGEAAVIIDLGGHDSYLNHTAASQKDAPFAITIDFGGNDNYEVADRRPAQGAGRFGLGLLLDFGGKDGYRAKVHSQGAGVMGIGLLVDVAGDDVYVGEECAQGSGVFGIGAVWDRQGTDRYRSEVFSQAFAGVGGFGLLLESDGWDSYLAGGKFRDFRDATISAISLSQGFSFGLRPYGDNPVGMSGGIAVLVDLAGNDNFQCDYFGQGASYYYGLGILVDDAGRDSYRCGRYSQGSGTHYTVGVLLDSAGDDTYQSYLGVSQGQGHDWSVGILVDGAGNDHYQLGWLGQGAGNAVGIGLLLDRAGDDSYEGTASAQGWGTWDAGRNSGSFGILLDSAGADRYNQPHRKESDTRFLSDGSAHRWGFFSDRQ